MGLASSQHSLLDDPTPLMAIELFNFLCDFRLNFKLIDCRSSLEYSKSHIDTAMHVDEMRPVVKNVHTSGSLQKLDAIVYYGGAAKSSAAAILKLKHKHKLSQLTVYILSETIDEFKQQFPFCCSDSPSYYRGMLYPSCIERRVYLSNLGVATNRAVLRNLGITHIVNCTVDGPYFDELPVTSLLTNNETGSIEIDSTQFEQPMIHIPETNNDPSGNISLFIPSHNRFRVPVVDDTDQNIQAYFRLACSFITHALAEKPTNNVLIHCKHGQSRSATIAVAWLISIAKYGVDDGIRHLKKCRPRVGPNAGFIDQLRCWENDNSGLRTDGMVSK